MGVVLKQLSETQDNAMWRPKIIWISVHGLYLNTIITLVQIPLYNTHIHTHTHTHTHTTV